MKTSVTKTWRALLYLSTLALLSLLLYGCSANSVQFSSYPSRDQEISGYIYKPEGNGPFPAMVLLHPCIGISDLVQSWGRRLKALGYVALLVDSNGSRGVGANCGSRYFNRDDVALDAYGALRYLQSQTFIDPDRIGVMGWSSGASAIFEALDVDLYPRTKNKPRFKAAVAYYPRCRLEHLSAPILILIGESDDWTPASLCAFLISSSSKLKAGGEPFRVRIYPGAYHAFDRLGPDTIFRGHNLEHDSGATVDSIERIKAFLAEKL